MPPIWRNWKIFWCLNEGLAWNPRQWRYLTLTTTVFVCTAPPHSCSLKPCWNLLKSASEHPPGFWWPQGLVYIRRDSVCDSLKKQTRKKNTRRRKRKKEKSQKGFSKSKMILAELSITILTLATLLAGSLQGPIQSKQGPPMNETNRIVAVVTESPKQSLASSGDGEVNETVTTSCPNYIPGNPGNTTIRNKTDDCSTGTGVDLRDHWTAFGLNKGRNTDWAACGLPRVPQAK